MVHVQIFRAQPIARQICDGDGDCKKCSQKTPLLRAGYILVCVTQKALRHSYEDLTTCPYIVIIYTVLSTVYIQCSCA